MNKAFNKIKLTLATIWASISSFPFKALGTDWEAMDFQTDYWIVYPSELLTDSEPTAITIIKIAQIWLTAVIFIVWIINFVKIRKTDDKSLKNKRIKRTIITLLAILVTILLLAVTIWLLKKYDI